jgi:hypothetical protein
MQAFHRQEVYLEWHVVIIHGSPRLFERWIQIVLALRNKLICIIVKSKNFIVVNYFL